VSARAGLALPTVPLLGWACGLADFDNDSWRDLWVANGHVYPNIGKAQRSSYEQEVLIARNNGGTFRKVERPFGRLANRSWRGGAAGDFNNDGRQDLVLTAIEGAPVLLENRSQIGNHWLGISLPLAKPGTSILVEACGRSWFDTIRSGGSYLSADDPRRHFGLGGCATVDQVKIRRRDSSETVIKGPKVDQYHTIDQ
jgi:hypothetical protein